MGAGPQTWREIATRATVPPNSDPPNPALDAATPVPSSWPEPLLMAQAESDASDRARARWAARSFALVLAARLLLIMAAAVALLPLVGLRGPYSLEARAQAVLLCLLGCCS